VEAVAWFPVREAIKLAGYKTEREVLQKAAALLAPLS